MKMIFKILEEFLLKISSLESVVYTFLGGIYVEVLMGGIDQPIKTGNPIMISNSPYKNSSVS